VKGVARWNAAKTNTQTIEKNGLDETNCRQNLGFGPFKNFPNEVASHVRDGLLGRQISKNMIKLRGGRQNAGQSDGDSDGPNSDLLDAAGRLGRST
jgi:hypothetical protein